EAFPFDTAPKYLLRDRDRIYGQEFRKQVEVLNIKEVLSAPRSPWQRAYVERIIGSIRRECLDHVIIFGEDSLRRTLRSYFFYYLRSRLHLSLDKDSPDPRPVQSVSEGVALSNSGVCITDTNVALREYRRPAVESSNNEGFVIGPTVSLPQPNTPQVHRFIDWFSISSVFRSYLFLLLMLNQESAVNEVFS